MIPTLLTLLLFPLPPRSPDLHFVDASLDVVGRLEDARFVDVDGDGAQDLCLVRAEPRGETGGASERVLELFRIEHDAIAQSPWFRLPIVPGVVAYAFADVRPEDPGLELLLLSRSGVFALSTREATYAGNLARVVEARLSFDIPDPRKLPYWRYVAAAQGGDVLLLPCVDGFALYGPAPRPAAGEGPRGYVRRAFFSQVPGRGLGDGAGDDGDGQFQLTLGPPDGGGGGGGGAEFEASSSPGGPFVRDTFLEARAARGGNLVSSGWSLLAPALLDVDGDGKSDLVRRVENSLALWLDVAAADDPGGSEALPEALRPEEDSLALTLVDLDGDGDRDLLAHLTSEADGIKNSTHTLLVFRYAAGQWFGAPPAQILRFEAATLRVQVADVDADGTPDLVLRKFVLPSLLGSVGGLEFELVHLVYFGEDGARPFARSPGLESTERYDEDTVAGVVARRDLGHDASGDGVADLLEIDDKGRLAIRRLVYEKGFFGGGEWTLEREPWKRFETSASLVDLEVRDVDGDGAIDLISRSKDTLTLLLSVPEEAR